MFGIDPRQTLLWLAAAGTGLLAGCDNDAPDDDLAAIRAPEIARVVSAKDALSGSQIPKLDPAPMNDAEVRKGVGTGPVCMFRYTNSGHPVLVTSMRSEGPLRGGVVKLNGYLVELRPADATTPPNGGFALVAEPVRLAVRPDREDRRPPDGVANMVFEVGQSLRVGYRGYLSCQSEPPAKSPRH